MNICLTGSPIDVTIYDIHRISIIAEQSQRVAVRTTVSYKGKSIYSYKYDYFVVVAFFFLSLVNTNQAGQGQLKVELIQPQTSKIPCRCHIKEQNSSEYLIQYIPIEFGRYQLRILFNNQLIQGKTFDKDVFFSLPSSSIVCIQQIYPNNIPQIGNEICLQSN